MEICWLCGHNLEQPDRAQKVTLYRGSSECEIRVPTCSQCARTVDRAQTWLGGLALLGLAGGIALGIVVGSWTVGIGAFVLGYALGGAAYGVVKIRGGARNRVTAYPRIRRMKNDGWSSLKPSQNQGQSGGVLKTCSHCGKTVPNSAHSGQTCPHCGAYWSFEKDRTPR